MMLRRALYYAVMPMAVALPLWLFISRGLLANESGYLFVAFLFASPILFVLLAIQAGILLARKQVRVEKAVSSLDVWFLLAIWVSFVAYGFLPVFPIAIFSTLAVAATFWVVVVELVQETRARVKTYVNDMAFTPQRPTQRRVQAPGDAGPIIVVPPSAIDEKSQN